ncbi:hypothetical protein [Psychromicrobium sp. YIM B11713]|uniref:hypothetical protein n=1 Tax=Psychromicrobium sp. YIM B11713 TaxID=3145233 RepID=UPI00374EE83C
MPWWSWIVIWVALVALSLLYVVLLGIKLWRHFVALGREVSHASERLSFAPSRGASPSGAASGDLLRQAVGEAATNESSAPAELREPGWAIHGNPTELRAEYVQGKQDRKAVRRDRRIARRRERGQAQSLSDLRHSGTDLTL